MQIAKDRADMRAENAVSRATAAESRDRRQAELLVALLKSQLKENPDGLPAIPQRDDSDRNSR